MVNNARNGIVAIVVALTATIALVPVKAQQDRGSEQERGQAIGIAQNAIRDRLQQERPASDFRIRFNDNANTEMVNNNRWRVTGSGTLLGNNRRRDFNYDATVNVRSANVQNVTYRWLNDGFPDDGSGGFPGSGRPPGGFPGERPPGGFPSGERPPGGFPGGGRPPVGGNRPEVPAGSAWVTGSITNAATGKSLDVPNWSREDGTPIQQWTFAGQPNQRFVIIRLPGRNLYAIFNENSRRVLDVSNWSREDGAQVQQFRWGDQENQKWQISSLGGGFFRIVNLNSGKCLDVRNKNREDGGEIHQWQCNGDRSQAWRLGR